jgi:hypothetical protein
LQTLVRRVKSPKLYWTGPALARLETAILDEVLRWLSWQRSHRTDARPLAEVLGTLAPRGAARDASRLGLVVTRGREVEPLAPGVWAE